MDRVLRCPGSRVLSAKLKKLERDDGYAGSMIHWMIADRLIREFGAIPPAGGLPPPSVPEGYKLPSMDLWIVEWAIRHVRDAIPSNWALYVEMELIYAFGRWIGSGHIDVLGINSEGTEAIAMDWKSGRDPVTPAESNDQVLTYMVLMRRAWPTLRRIRFDIGQPRNSENDGFERISTVSVPPADSPYNDELLTVCMNDLDRRVCESLDNWAELSPGRIQCKWCDCGLACPCIKLKLQSMKATLTPEFLATVKAVPDDAQLVDLLIDSRIVARAIEDVEGLLHERLAGDKQAVGSDGTRVRQKIVGGSYSVENPQGCWQAVKSLIPESRIPEVVKYSTERLIDEIAEAQSIPKGGNQAMTGKKVFDAVIKPNLKQGERRLFIFST